MENKILEKIELSEDTDGVIITDKSYEFSDSHEIIWIPKEIFKEVIEYFQRRLKLHCSTCNHWVQLNNETFNNKPLGLCGRFGLKFTGEFYCIKYEKRG